MIAKYVSKLVHRELPTRTGSIQADPNPIPISDLGSFGATRLSWTSEGTSEVEVHQDAPDGPLISRSGPSGSMMTERCITNGSEFYLQDVSGGLALVPSHTLDVVTVFTYNAGFASHLPCAAPRETLRHHAPDAGRVNVLVAGWFSFEDGAATAGDLLARDLTCEWLRCAGYAYDVAVADVRQGGVDWREVEPDAYSDVVFVCGPFARNCLSEPFLERFARCRKIGLNLSMTEPLDVWSPFDALLERDSSNAARPELAFASRQRRVPVVGVIPVEPVPEYPDRAMHDVANAAIRRVLAQREAAIVEIDTRLPNNLTGLRSPAEIESLIARMDLVLTTRLHGMVLALKNGVPAIAIDPHAGGSKVRRQADTIGWPLAFNPDKLSEQELLGAFDYCTTDAARVKARECTERAERWLDMVRAEFLSAVSPLRQIQPGSVGNRIV